MVDNRDFPKVFSVCTASFPHVLPAITFRKKRGVLPEIPDLLAFATIWWYAPSLFEDAAIESLFQFVSSSRVLGNPKRGFCV